MDEQKMEDYQTKGTIAHGTKGSLISHYDSHASLKLIERCELSNTQRNLSSKTAESVAIELNSIASTTGIMCSEKEQEEFKVTLKNTTNHIYVPREVRINGDLYAQSSLTTLGPGESGDLKLIVNNSKNLENGNMGLNIKGLIVGGDSDASGSVELDMHIDRPDTDSLLTLYKINTDTYGNINCNDSVSGERKQILTLVEFEPKDTFSSNYPSFCIASYSASEKAHSFFIDICL